MNEWTAGLSRPATGVGVVVAIASGLALTACGGPSVPSERLDARWVESLHSGGFPAPQGDGDAAAMLSTAARTTCGGGTWQAVVTGRRDPAPTSHETAAVTAARDSRRLVALALGAYCP